MPDKLKLHSTLLMNDNPIQAYSELWKRYEKANSEIDDLKLRLTYACGDKLRLESELAKCDCNLNYERERNINNVGIADLEIGELKDKVSRQQQIIFLSNHALDDLTAQLADYQAIIDRLKTLAEEWQGKDNEYYGWDIRNDTLKYCSRRLKEVVNGK